MFFRLLYSAYAAPAKAGSAWNNVQKTVHKAVKDTGNTVKKAGQDTGKTLSKAGKDLGGAATKAGSDTANEVIRAPKNLDRARLTLQRFGEREVQGVGQTLSDAEKRVRQGKFADAIWHLTIDPLKHTEGNAARMVQENSILRTIGQVAATAYGGAGGAAAYASWYTYRTTNNPELALRVGMITGATCAAMDQVGKMPNGPIDPATHHEIFSPTAVTKKTLVAGSIGGLAVAASGGDEKALRDGFLYSGGTILVQGYYETTTWHKIDAKASNEEAFAMDAAPGEPGAPPREAYYNDDGTPYLDKNGRQIPDVRKLPARVARVGRWSKADNVGITSERSLPMTAISKIPAMNAMALLHDQWAVYYDMNVLTSVGTIPVATVITYIGTGTQMYDLIQKTASQKAETAKQNYTGGALNRRPGSVPVDAITSAQARATHGWVARVVINCEAGADARSASEAAAEATFEAIDKSAKVDSIVIDVYVTDGSLNRRLGSVIYNSRVRSFTEEQVARWIEIMEEQIKAMPGAASALVWDGKQSEDDATESN